MTQHTTPRYLPKRNENLDPPKDQYKEDYSGFIYNLPKLGTTYTPINWCVDM